ncbi:MAG: hypothetical protein PHT87_06400 [Bacteroidales bacterium]|nr:hypothetical protein [Bacteroidales bacterium]MDD4640630.1 hypothetical protein [Bacteroidales bacterium]
MKSTFLCLLLFVCLGLQAQAQSFEEYMRQEQEKMKQFEQEQIEGMERLRKEYAAYVAKRDQEWADYLKKEWENYSAFAAKELPVKPKPQTSPVFDNSSQIETKTISAARTENLKPESLPSVVEPVRKPAETASNFRTANFNFYNRSLAIPYDPAMRGFVLQGLSQESIGAFWNKISESNYTPAVESLLEAKKELNINDYAYMLLCQYFSKSLYPANANAARLMTWFVMLRSGYSLRVGFNNEAIALLVPTQDQLYQKAYLNLEGINYYIFPDLENNSLYTYDKDYHSGKPVSFGINSPMNLGGKTATRAVSFEFEGKTYDIRLSYDPDLIDFFQYYPLLTFETYFNAPMSVQSREALYTALQPVISEMDEVQAVNFILRFVQTAFAYKTDPEQFGREKYFFAEEVLHYPYCDCEDRSVLFSYLVREFLGLNVVGLEYPGHMATAVAFKSPFTGNQLVYNNQRYVIADPTFINAPLGVAMPEYSNVAPVIHEIANLRGRAMSLAGFWEELSEKGCYKGSFRKNAKLLSEGSAVLTGYFAEAVQLGGTTLSGNSKAHNCFVAKVNPEGKVLWANKLSSSDNAVGMSVDTQSSGNIVVAGVFTGVLQDGGYKLQAAEGKSDLFMAGYSPEGRLLWLSKAGLDELPQTIHTAFTAVFSPAGDKISTQHAGEQLEESQQGLFIGPEEQVLYSGMINNALAVAGNKEPVAFASEASLDIPGLFKAESAKFIGQKTDPAMAGLFAACKLVKDMGISLTGKAVQETLDKNNPGFKTSCPNIYKNFGAINFVRNAQGIISILTVDKKNISFDKVRISNNSTISITEIPGSNYRIDVLSGIKVGMAVVWFELNFIKMLASNGDMIFDYSGDHSQVSINLQKDILE